MEGRDLALRERTEPRPVPGEAGSLRAAIWRLPNYWKIVDGKLYLNYDASVQKNWEKDIPGHIVNANKNWPKVLDK